MVNKPLTLEFRAQGSIILSKDTNVCMMVQEMLVPLLIIIIVTFVQVYQQHVSTRPMHANRNTAL